MPDQVTIAADFYGLLLVSAVVTVVGETVTGAAAGRRDGGRDKAGGGGEGAQGGYPLLERETKGKVKILQYVL